MLGAIVATRGMGALLPERVRAIEHALAPHADRVVLVGTAPDESTRFERLPTATELDAVAETLHEAAADHAIVVAADAHHPSSELIRYMLQVRGSFDVVAPERRDGALELLLALYHPRCLHRIEGLIAAGESELSALKPLATIRRVAAEEVAKFGDPAELLARG